MGHRMRNVRKMNIMSNESLVFIASEVNLLYCMTNRFVILYANNKGADKPLYPSLKGTQKSLRYILASGIIQGRGVRFFGSRCKLYIKGGFLVSFHL